MSSPEQELVRNRSENEKVIPPSKSSTAHRMEYHTPVYKLSLQLLHYKQVIALAIVGIITPIYVYAV